MEHHQNELRKLRETFAPTLERLVSVRIGLPFHVAPVSYISHLAMAQDYRPATSEAFETVDTSRLMRMCIDIPAEAVIFAFGKNLDTWFLAEQELRNAASVLVSKLMAEAWDTRQKRA